MVVNLDDSSKIALIGEKFWHGLNADVEFIPVLLPEDLGKVMPEIPGIRAKWGK